MITNAGIQYVFSSSTEKLKKTIPTLYNYKNEPS